MEGCGAASRVSVVWQVLPRVEGLVLMCCVVLIVGWDCWMGK